MANKKPITMVSPIGIMGWSHLDKPDAKGKSKFGDDKYKSEVRFLKTGADDQVKIDEFVAVITKMHDAAGGEPGECPIKDGDATKKQKNEDTGKIEKVRARSEEYSGHWWMRSKSFKRPGVIDTKRNPLPATLVRAGDRVRLIFEAAEYAAGKNFGLTCRLVAVQLIEKADDAALNAAKAAAALGDDDVEGYVVSADELENEVDGAKGDY